MLSLNDFSAKQILFLVTKEKEKLSFRNDNILIMDADGKIKHQSSCYRLFAIFIIGHISITSVIIQKSRQFGFSIILLTDSFRPYQLISNTAEANIILRKKQYDYTGLGAAQQLIRNKIGNQQKTLQSIRSHAYDTIHTVKLLKEYQQRIMETKSIQELMGVEGTASRLFFREFYASFEWKGRKPRVKPDMINALQDIGYTILFCYIDAMLSLFGFDRYCGILHRQFYMRKSLVCDLVEPFRVIIDKQIRKSINLNQFKKEDFEIYEKKWCLRYKESAAYSSVFIGAIMAEKESIYTYVREFYRVFMKDKLENEMPYWEVEK